ncbi:MAG: hypothetical protein DA328_10010 [Nitrososphaeraceae archaeon]|nr:hypothetical protein [Nitrososphaeraceae archaeon]
MYKPYDCSDHISCGVNNDQPLRYSFAVPHGSRYKGPIQVANRNGEFVTIQALVDSVTGDSRLYWKIGDDLKFGTMEDLFSSYMSAINKDEYKILSVKRDGKLPYNNKTPILNCNNIKPCFIPIQDVVYHGIKPVYKITLRNGKTIKITKDHCLFHNEKGSYQTEIKSTTLDKLKSVVSVDNYLFEGNPIPYTDDILTFMGLWMADGSFSKNDTKIRGVHISTGDNPKILEWLNKFTVEHTVNSKGGALKYITKGDVGIYNTQFGLQISELFGENADSYTKRIPKELFIATKHQISCFLKGYFSGDGSIHIMNDNAKLTNYKYGSYYTIDCSSVNKELLEDVGLLLDRLGIKYNISEGYLPSTSGFKSKNLQYKLSIHAYPSTKKFIEQIGLIKEFTFKERDVYQRDKKQRPVSLRQIRKIEYIGQEPVYDISVAYTEAFIANGILCHNSGNDITIFTRSTADMLGFNPDLIQDRFFVKGINGPGSEFALVQTYLKFGNLPPIKAPVGFALSNESLSENLIGKKGVFDSGLISITYDEDSVDIVSKIGNRVTCCGWN